MVRNRYIRLVVSLILSLPAVSLAQVQLGARPDAGSTTVTVLGQSKSTLSIYAIDPGLSITTCGPDVILNGKPLQFPATTGGGTTMVTDALGTTQAKTLTLNAPLVARTTLCLVETQTSSWKWNPTPVSVNDPNDYGLFRTYFNIGIQATNQQSSGGSSTAGEYLEAGFNSSYRRPTNSSDKFCGSNLNQTCHLGFGLGSNVDVRLSPIPVAGTSTTTSVSTVATTIAPNQLSAQTGVRLVSSVFAPLKVQSWNNNADSFTLAPVARGGFGTLLNPSSSAATTGSTANTSQITTTKFTPGFDFWGVGARFAWEKFVPKRDEGPKTVTQFLLTLGENSNLPSYVCKPAKGPTNPYSSVSYVTACNLGADAPTGSATAGYSYFTFNRTLRPRMDVEGFAKLPQYPFILGMDADLQQYAIFTKPNIDYLNKPGNDIRVWAGIQVDLPSLISKL